MNRFLLSLWLGGGVLYAGSTLLSQNAGNPFAGDHDRLKALQPTAGSSVLGKEEDAKGSSPTTSEKWKLESASEKVASRGTGASPEPPSPTEEPPSPESSAGEILTVTSPAIIHEGPSTAADVIGTAQPGAEIQVARRQSDWVHFVDPVWGRSGWIHTEVLKPQVLKPQVADKSSDSQATTEDSQQPQSNEKQATSAVQRGRKDDSAPKQTEADEAVAAKDETPVQYEKKSADKTPKPAPAVEPRKKTVPLRPPPWAAEMPRPPHEQAGLPPDEEFMQPRKRRFGILARRRMFSHAPPPWADASPRPSLRD